MKYKIEYGVENKRSLSTTKCFDSANEVKELINFLDKNVWLVVEYANTQQEILRRNYGGCVGVKYNDSIKCPKVLLNL